MSTPLAVSCPNCGAGLKLKSKTFVGKKVPCPKCKQPFVVEEPPEDEFMEDDFGGGDDYQEEEEEEQPRAKKASKGGKGKKKSKGGGGSGIALMIGGGLLGVGLLVGVVYGAMSLLSGMGGSNHWTAWMPADTHMVIHVRTAELANSQFLKPVMDHPVLSKLASSPATSEDGDGMYQIGSILNFSLRDVESITIGGKSFNVQGGGGKSLVAAIRTKVSLDVSKLDQAPAALTKETHAGKSVYAINNTNPKLLVYAASTNILVMGTDPDVRAVIDQNGKGPGKRFTLSDPNAQLSVCVAPEDPSVFDQPAQQNGETPQIASLFVQNRPTKTGMKSAQFSINFSTDAKMTLLLNTLNAQGEADELKREIEKAKAELNGSAGAFDMFAGLKGHAKTMLDGAQVNVSGQTTTMTMTLPGKIVSDGLVMATPIMPLLEQELKNRQKATTATPAAPKSASPVGITDYPSTVINAGNNAQNRINNLGDQHNSDIAAQMQEGGAGAAHGAPSAAAAPAAGGSNDTAAAMMQQQANGGRGAHGAPGAPSAAAPAAPAAGGGNDAAAAMMQQQANGGRGAHGGPPGAAPAAPAAGGANDPAAAMMQQQANGGAARDAHGGPGGAAPPAGGAGAADPAEMMRRQQGGGGGQPAAEGQNGNETKPAPKSRSRRRSS